MAYTVVRNVPARKRIRADMLCIASCPCISAGELLGSQNLLQVPEPRHKYLRNLIMPAFTSEAIEKLVPRMETVLKRYLDKWAGR